MTLDHFKKSMVLLTAFREERVNQFEGMRGVLHVIKNRTENKQYGFPDDMLTVVVGHNQFASMSDARDSQTVAYPVSDDPEFNKLIEVVDAVFLGDDPDNTNKAYFYADTSSPKFYKNGWFSDVILKNPQRFPPVAQIGTTTYYGQIS